MGLTKTETLSKIQLLFDKFFDANALLDRQVYLLDIMWNMPHYQDYIHHSISHLMPLLADDIQTFGSLRGDLFYRGIVPEHKETYDTVTALTEDYVSMLGDIESLCSQCILLASKNEDLMYEDFLRDFEINKIAKLTKQATIFYNAIRSYESSGNIFKWEDDFDSYIIDNNGGN
jgi:hypothetical protein